jgi:transcriptional regulator with XRE-family HTH domain
MSFTPAQCRAARALIGWSQDQLANASKVAKATIANFETGDRAPYARTLADIRGAFEAAGVDFTNGDHPGVQLQRQTPGEIPMTPEIFGLLMQRFHALQFAHLSENLATYWTGLPAEKLQLGWNHSEAILFSDKTEIGRITLSDGKLAFTPELPKSAIASVEIDRLWNWVMESWRLHSGISELPKLSNRPA